MRAAKCTIIAGYNGTGKTTVLKEIINSVIEKERVLVVEPDYIEMQNLEIANINLPLTYNKEARRIIADRYSIRTILSSVYKNFNNGLLIFDDSRMYFVQYMYNELHDFLVRRRQKMIDVIAVGHGFTEIAPPFFTFCSEIILFETKDNIYKRKNEIREFDRILKEKQYVDQKAVNDKHYCKIIKY